MSKKRVWWDFFGKVLRSKDQIPPGMGFCYNCGRLYPKEDLHLVLVPGGENMKICDECSDLSPSQLRNNYGRKQVSRDEQLTE